MLKVGNNNVAATIISAQNNMGVNIHKLRRKKFQKEIETNSFTPLKYQLTLSRK